MRCQIVWASVLLLGCTLSTPAAWTQEAVFYRGDCNYSMLPDGYAVDVSDAAALLSYLFAGGNRAFFPPCLDACDCNDDGEVGVDDAVCIVQYYFEQGAVPPPPGPGLDFSGPGDPTPTEPGPDPTEDDLDCGVGSPFVG